MKRTISLSDRFRLAPRCKYQRKVKLSNGLVIAVCDLRKGSGRHNQYCQFVGAEPMCKYYTTKKKIGRNLYDIIYQDFYGG